MESQLRDITICFLTDIFKLFSNRSRDAEEDADHWPAD